METLPYELRQKIAHHLDATGLFKALYIPSLHPFITLLYHWKAVSDLTTILQDILPKKDISAALVSVAKNVKGDVSTGLRLATLECLLAAESLTTFTENRQNIVIIAEVEDDELYALIDPTSTFTKPLEFNQSNTNILAKLSAIGRVIQGLRYLVSMRIASLNTQKFAVNDYFLDSGDYYLPNLKHLEMADCDTSERAGALSNDFLNLKSLKMASPTLALFQSFTLSMLTQLTKLQINFISWLDESTPACDRKNCITGVSLPNLKEAKFSDISILRNVLFPKLETLCLTSSRPLLIFELIIENCEFPTLKRFEVDVYRPDLFSLTNFKVGNDLTTLVAVNSQPYVDCVETDQYLRIGYDQIMENTQQLTTTRSWIHSLCDVQSDKITFLKLILDQSNTAPEAIVLSNLETLELSISYSSDISLPHFSMPSLKVLIVHLRTRDTFDLKFLKEYKFAPQIQQLIVINEPNTRNKNLMVWPDDILNNFTNLSYLKLRGFDILLSGPNNKLILPQTVRKLDILENNVFHKNVENS